MIKKGLSYMRFPDNYGLAGKERTHVSKTKELDGIADDCFRVCLSGNLLFSHTSNPPVIAVLTPCSLIDCLTAFPECWGV